MNAYTTNEQVINQDNEKDEAKVPFEQPEVTDMGKVEQLTALAGGGTPDVLHLLHGNLV